MSNSGVNAGFAKCFICFMALIILLQGCVYLGLALRGITLKQCPEITTDVKAKPLLFVIDLIYFLNKDCGEPQINVSNTLQPITINVNWGESDAVANREYIFMIAYAAISALWIVTSLLVVGSICRRITTVVKALCFWPWFLVIIGGSILDAVATGYHIKDILHTTSLQKTFDYLGLSTSQNGLDILETFDAYFITPSVIMTCISSRIALVWLLNIFGSSFCLSLSNALSNRNSSTKSSVTSAATTVTAPLTASQVQSPVHREQQHHIQELPQQQRSANPQRQEPPLIKPKPLLLQSASTVQRQSSIPPPSSNHPRQYDAPSAPSPYVSSPTSDVVTYRSTDTHPDRLNYPSHQQQQQRPVQPQQSLDNLSAISPLNNRYSTGDGFTYSQQQNQRVSEELRGQLPWSYTSIPPPTPKKPQMQVYPEIPEPDYGN